MKGLVTIKNPLNRDTPVVYGGTATLTAGTTTVITLPGVVATDAAICTSNSAIGVTKAVCTADTVTLTTASASGGEQVSYLIFRNI